VEDRKVTLNNDIRDSLAFTPCLCAISQCEQMEPPSPFCPEAMSKSIAFMDLT
jgi:hypothetical protein